jgi:hypothetical protein
MVCRPACLGVKPHLGPKTSFYYSHSVEGFLMWGALSGERTGLSFTLAACLASAVILGSETCWTHDHILLTLVRDSSNLEGQVPVFISSRNSVAQLYPQIRQFLFIVSYDSQGYGGGIRTCIHTGCSRQFINRNYSLLHRLESDGIENAASNISSFGVYLFVTWQWLVCLITLKRVYSAVAWQWRTSFLNYSVISQYVTAASSFNPSHSSLV